MKFLLAFLVWMLSLAYFTYLGWKASDSLADRLRHALDGGDEPDMVTASRIYVLRKTNGLFFFAALVGSALCAYAVYGMVE